MYDSYATSDFYTQEYGGMEIPAGELVKSIRQASRHIDSLTYNRIVGQGFSNLTEFQQEIIQEAVCQQAEFEYENSDAINSALSGYGINGVSVQFGAGINAQVQDGIVIRKDTYALLKQTGLCCRLAVF